MNSRSISIVTLIISSLSIFFVLKEPSIYLPLDEMTNFAMILFFFALLGNVVSAFSKNDSLSVIITSLNAMNGWLFLPYIMKKTMDKSSYFNVGEFMLYFVIFILIIMFSKNKVVKFIKKYKSIYQSNQVN